MPFFNTFSQFYTNQRTNYCTFEARKR